MKKLTILMVDDNSGDQFLVKKALEESGQGTELLLASDGEEALEFLSRAEKDQKTHKPDLVMLDLNLPKISGREVLAEIRHDPKLRHLPVIIVTGAKATHEMAATCELNPNFYVMKPVELEGLFAVVKAIEEYGISMLRVPKNEREHSEKLREKTAA